MSKKAFIFPGQGAQYVGMGRDFYEQFEESRQVFDKANEILGLDIKSIIFEENEKINITEYTQAAMITTIAAMLAHINTLGIKPDVCAGLSLGEYAALIESKVLSAEDAIRIVRQRGIFMQEAVPQGLGSMAAVLGMDNGVVEKICEETSGIVTVANYNCPGQVVISGEADAVERAGKSLIEAGAKRIVPLKVSGPFHSKMLVNAGEKLKEELMKISIHEPQVPYVSNATAEYVIYEKDILSLLTEQVSSSVRWQQSVEAMIADGVDTFIEIGPGKTLSSFIKKIDRSKKVINIDKVEDLEKLREV
ncbi:MAG: ACP S-malonyltransferase [Clostridiales bacterium]|nr:ACP S-malonyltransferase [Clostridiales bacterium]